MQNTDRSDPNISIDKNIVAHESNQTFPALDMIFRDQ